MAESNLKEMMIDDINDDEHEENEITNDDKLAWYLIDTDKTFCKVWNFMITCLIIYSLFVTPYVMVFQDVYMNYDSETDSYQAESSRQKSLVKMEYFIDIVYFIEIIFNFVKKTRAHTDVQTIAVSYMSGFFVFDVIGTIPVLVMQQSFKYYWLKLFRCLVHVMRLSIPLELGMGIILHKQSKKRQNDLITFFSLIVGVIFVAHVMGCIWLSLGGLYPCKIDGSLIFNTDGDADDYMDNRIADCTPSWIYDNDFEKKSYRTQYIFAFYWIFEVITTVGYGDYSGKTSEEYIFSIILEFLGLTFFSFLMGSINGIFNTSDSFDDLIEEKLDNLDMWIKKIEKSNKPLHIQPTLYSDIRKYVEQAFKYDFNLVIEEFSFY